MATHCKARPLIMNLREPGSAPPTPWQCEMAAVASTLRKLLPAAGRAGTPPRTLWWGAGYSDLPAECAREIGSESRRISGHVRQLLTQLRPYGLEESGMREALRELVAAWQARLPDLQIQAHIGPLPAVSADVGLAMYRCVQEALTNCVRHSGAKHMEVTVGVLARENLAQGDPQRERIEVTVSDNGTGQAHVLQRQPGSGLLGLRERLAMVGGQLTISDRAGGGVVLSATLPVQDKETL